jgi:stalled ribosome alternative rescue factor ArfA
MALRVVRSEATKTSLEIDKKLWHDVKIRAALEDVDIRGLVEQALKSYLYTGSSRALKFRNKQHKAIWRQRVEKAKKEGGG